MQSRLLSVAFAAIIAGITSPAFAATIVYNVSLNGQNEIIGGRADGDLDGSAVGTLTVNTDDNTISWALTLANIDTPTDFHIHTGAFNQQGGVLIGFGVPGGSIVGNSFSGTKTVTGQDIIDTQTVINNPQGHYLNIHNAAFPGGAVRGQVPEPSTAVLALLGGLGCVFRRRR